MWKTCGPLARFPKMSPPRVNHPETRRKVSVYHLPDCTNKVIPKHLPD